MKKLYYIINGSNLNMLGTREPDVYGSESYKTLKATVKAAAKRLGVRVRIFQSNHEGYLVDLIQKAYFVGADGVIINPGAYTHTSVAILDALSAVAIPTVEVHISNVMEREEFRHHSFVSLVAKKTYMGLGFEGYRRAIRYLTHGEE